MSENNQSLEEILFDLAVQKPSAAERATFLSNACRDNPSLRAALDELLDVHFGAAGFLSKKAPCDPLSVTSPLSALSEAPAQMLGRYKLLERIGEGGFGEVWMAEQREPVKRRVALKIIKLGMDSRQIVARFEAERQALAMMDHANIARIFDADVSEAGRPYFVMELVRGTKITDYCDQNQLPTRDRLALFIRVCQAIQHAHQKGIIHRDIKPSNILVTVNDGVPVPKVIDFGIAKATQGELTDKTVFTQFQQFIGTPAYISPEQAEMSSLDIDTRADIYSLGVLLYELLVGQTPFDAREMMQGGLDELRRIIREKEPLRPSTKLNTLPGDARTTAGKRRQTDAGKLVHQLQGDLDWIVLKCLEKDRARRYETANGLAMDIQRHLANEPIVARPPSTAYKIQKAWQRNKLVFTAAVAVALVLVVGISVSTWQAVEATRARQAEKEQRIAAQKAQAAALLKQKEAEEAWKNAEAARVSEATHRRLAESLLTESSATHVSDAWIGMKLAVLQLWFGKDAEYATTCRRMLTWASETTDASTADRVAKLVCLRQNADAPTREAALSLARKGVELGKGTRQEVWSQLSLGMAEFRSGHYPAADEALTVAAQSESSFDGDEWQARRAGIASFYRAMSLFHQGKQAEARTLFTVTEAKMKPLPTDDQSPLADGANADDLILWLACKEARALLQMPASSARP